MGARRATPIASARPSGASGAVVRALPFVGDDAALVDAMLRGRADAVASFYDRHARGVHLLVFRLMGPDHELDDVVHDVFVRALESLDRLRDPSALRPWLMGIAVTVARIRFQRRRRQRWLRFFAPEDLPDVAYVPDTDLGEAVQEAYVILREMSDDERVALVLHRVEGLPLHEAAEAAGMSLSTFRRRLARAETRLFARARGHAALAGWLREGSPK